MSVARERASWALLAGALSCPLVAIITGSLLWIGAALVLMGAAWAVDR